jgi:peptidyl-prolyl cis-trans isomerase B (cyclophilin B)
MIARRKRDNLVFGLVVALVAVLATGSQVIFATSHTPAPEASSAATPSAEQNGAVPNAALSENRQWTGTMVVNGIPLGVELDGAAAPQAVASTIALATSGFYDGTTCHRLTNVGIWVLQCGDPQGDGTGGPGYSYGPIENAPTGDLYPAGTLAMARQGGNGSSMGSQFFIVYKDSVIPSDAAGGYTIIGKVTSGLPELQAAIIDGGTEDGSADGRPKVPTTISTFTVQ